VLGGWHKYVDTIAWYMDGQKNVNLQDDPEGSYAIIEIIDVKARS